MTAEARERPNPYVGPRAFQTGEVLFGRDRETENLVDLVLADRIVLLHSQSGAGKTSMLQAKVIPRLREEGLNVWPITQVGKLPPTEPTGPYNRYVLSALSKIEHGQPSGATPDRLAGLTLDQYLKSQDKPGIDVPAVLIFDQFEELLTLDATDLDAKNEFCRQVGAVLRTRPLWAIFAMREEFIGGLAPFLHLLPTKLSSRYRLELLSPDKARQAIERPAAKASVRFTEDAIQELVDDLRKVRQQISGTKVEDRPGPYIEPVHLQVVCTRLWVGLKGASLVESSHIDSVGDVDDALGEYYANAVKTAADKGKCEERDVREWIETKLIAHRVRSQALRGSEADCNVSPEAVEALEAVYVVRRDERRGGVWYELAHDRLVIPILKDNARWRETMLTELEKQAARWHDEGRPSHLLFKVRDWGDVWLLFSKTTISSYFGGSDRRPVPEKLRSFVKASRERALLRLVFTYGVLLAATVTIFGLQSRSGAKAVKAQALAIQREKELAVKARDSLQQVTDSLTLLEKSYYQRVWGLERATPRLVEQSIAANLALQSASKTSLAPDRKAITIEYFYKRRDPERVEFALRDLGYQVVVKRANLEVVGTNAIYFGTDVYIADVRIIALALLRSGAQLQRICAFPNSSRRQRIVQIMGAVSAQQKPLLEVPALESLEKGSLPCP